MIFRLALLVVCLGASLWGQADYVFRHTVAISAASTAIALQQPASNAATVRPYLVSISTDTAISVTIERDCTTPSTTTAANAQIVALNPSSTTFAAKVQAFTAANGTGCTIVGGPHTIPAGVSSTIPLTKLFMDKPGTNRSIVVRVASATANITFNLPFQEIRQ